MKRDVVYDRLTRVGASHRTATYTAVMVTNDAPKAKRRVRHLQTLKHKEAA